LSRSAAYGRKARDRRRTCDGHGVFVGGISLLQAPSAGNPHWRVRPVAELNKELTARYRLPIDIAPKAGSLALIAAALNRNDLAMAAIAVVQMQLPDPPPLANVIEAPNEIIRRASELRRSRLLKVWDPDEHPRTGTPPNPGWFAPKPGGPEAPAYAEMDEPDREDPQRRFHPQESMGGGGGGSVPGAPQPDLQPPAGAAQSPSSPGSAPTPPAQGEAQSVLPFPGGLPPQLAPYVPGGKTSGILYTPGNPPISLQSGYDGPAEGMPPGSPGFDGLTLSHVEGHAAAVMQQGEIMEGTLYINNPNICGSCMRLLPTMLPPGAILNVVLPDNTVIQFIGVGP
jgi:hypothetical protein